MILALNFRSSKCDGYMLFNFFLVIKSKSSKRGRSVLGMPVSRSVLKNLSIYKFVRHHLHVSRPWLDLHFHSIGSLCQSSQQPSHAQSLQSATKSQNRIRKTLGSPCFANYS